MKRCSCGTDYSRKHKKCTKENCGGHFIGYKVVLRTPARNKISRIVGKSVREAERIESQLKEDIRNNRYCSIKKITLNDVWDQYKQELNDEAGNPKVSAKDDIQRYRDHIEPYIGQIELQFITAEMIRKRIVHPMAYGDNPKKHKYAAATQRQVIQVISRLYNVAKRDDIAGYTGTNPTEGVSQIGKKARRKKIPLPDPKRIFNEARKYMTINPSRSAQLAVWAFRFALITGARRGEIFSLKWENINWENGYIEFLDTKNGDDILRPICSATKVILTNMLKYRVEEHELVWHHEDGRTFYHAYDHHFRRICSNAGITNKMLFRAHDARRMLGSYLSTHPAVSKRAIQDMLGHEDSKTTEEYIQPVLAEQKQAAEFYNEVLEKMGVDVSFS